MSERLRCLPQYLQRIEAGRENLTLKSLTRLANLLGVDPAALLAKGTRARKTTRR
jgi:transcriptional regulator with XRE-family HTH domain